MKTNEFTGVYHMMDQIDPEAYKAQRLQELKDLAEYRARHFAQITAWSVEENRLERQRQHEDADLEARMIANEKAKSDPNYIISLMSAKEWVPMGGTGFAQKPVYETRFKVSKEYQGHLGEEKKTSEEGLLKHLKYLWSRIWK